MVETWLGKDYPVDNPDELLIRLAGQRRWPNGMRAAQERGELREIPEVEAEAGERMTSAEAEHRFKVARAQKTEEEAKLRALQVEAEEGRSIPRDQVERDSMRLAALEKSYWMQLAEVLPPMLEGLTAGEMKPKLEQYARKQLEELYRKTQELAG